MTYTSATASSWRSAGTWTCRGAGVDAAGKIVAPGLVDTHWHMWNTLLRGMSDGVA